MQHRPAHAWRSFARQGSLLLVHQRSLVPYSMFDASTLQGSGSSSGGRTASAARLPRPAPAHGDLQPSVSQRLPAPAPQPLSPRPYAADPLAGTDREGGAASSWPYNPGAAAESLYHSSGFGGPVFDTDRGFAGPDHGFDIPGLGGDSVMDVPGSTGDSGMMSGETKHLGELKTDAHSWAADGSCNYRNPGGS